MVIGQAGKKIKNFVKEFFTPVVKVVATVGAAVLSFDVDASVGLGIGVAAEVADIGVSAVAKNTVTAEISYDNFDIGSEESATAAIGITQFEEASLEIKTGTYKSYITGESEDLSSVEPELAVTIFDASLYFGIGANLGVAFNIETFEDLLIKIW